MTARRRPDAPSPCVPLSLHAGHDAHSDPRFSGRLEALDRAPTCNHPTDDIGEMLADIERGRDLRGRADCFQ